MSETKYTPGPWHVEAGAVWAEAQDGANLKLASIYPVLNYVSMGQRNDNARLIAAAPELLEVLKDILAHVEDADLERMGTNQCTLCHTFRMKAHGTIAKAEGGE